MSRKRILSIAASVVAGLVALWLIGSVYLLSQAPKMVFEPGGSHNLPVGFGYEQKFARLDNGQNIDFMWYPNSSSQEVILYLHGNIGRLLTYIPDLGRYANVLSPAYPGYSLSEGSPTSDNILQTADLSIKMLKNMGYQEEQIMVWGHSLGGSPAVYLASKYPKLKKVVLVGTFSSIQSMCERSYSILCVLGGGILNSTKYAPEVKVKVRQFHLPTDKVVPYEEGRKLFEKISSSDKKFSDLKGETHSYFSISQTMED